MEFSGAEELFVAEGPNGPPASVMAALEEEGKLVASYKYYPDYVIVVTNAGEKLSFPL
jgi:hypothetical protein